MFDEEEGAKGEQYSQARQLQGTRVVQGIYFVSVGGWKLTGWVARQEYFEAHGHSRAESYACLYTIMYLACLQNGKPPTPSASIAHHIAHHPRKKSEDGTSCCFYEMPQAARRIPGSRRKAVFPRYISDSPTYAWHDIQARYVAAHPRLSCLHPGRVAPASAPFPPQKKRRGITRHEVPWKKGPGNSSSASTTIARFMMPLPCFFVGGSFPGSRPVGLRPHLSCISSVRVFMHGDAHGERGLNWGRECKVSTRRQRICFLFRGRSYL